MSDGALMLPLLDYLAREAGCVYLSDLPRAGRAERERAFHALERVPPEEVSLREWNDALNYLAQAPPEQTARAARERLLSVLDADATDSHTRRKRP